MNIYEAFTKAKNEGGYAACYGCAYCYDNERWRAFYYSEDEWMSGISVNKLFYILDDVLSDSWQHVTELSQIEEKEG